MAPSNPDRVERLGRTDVPRVIDTLCQAFHDYPVMRYVLGDAPEPYEQWLQTLIGLFV